MITLRLRFHSPSMVYPAIVTCAGSEQLRVRRMCGAIGRKLLSDVVPNPTQTSALSDWAFQRAALCRDVEEAEELCGLCCKLSCCNGCYHSARYDNRLQLLCMKCVTLSSLCCCNLPVTFAQCIAC